MKQKILTLGLLSSCLLYVACQKIIDNPISEPIVSTVVKTDISANNAIGGGIITSDGGSLLTACGVCWSSSQNPTIANNKTIDSIGLGAFTSHITGLGSNTTYYVKAYATNEVGTVYGEEVSFNTSSRFKFVVSDNYSRQSSRQTWIAVSDDSDVLYTQKIQDGETYETPNILVDYPDVHIFQVYDSSVLIVDTHNDVTIGDWYFSNNSLTPIGTIDVSISDLRNFSMWDFSTEFASFHSNYLVSRPIQVFFDPTNVLIKYYPSDNSPLRYKYVQNLPINKSYSYLMSDFKTASGLVSYNLPTYSYFVCDIFGYNSNSRFDYLISSYRFSNSAVSKFDMYYPNDIFENYLSVAEIGDVLTTKYLTYYKYGSIPTELPVIWYADINHTNEINIDQFTANIGNPGNYQVFTSKFSKYLGSQAIYWDIHSKPNSAITNSLPDIPAEILQLSSFFNKSDLTLSNSYLSKYFDGQISSYSDWINWEVKTYHSVTDYTNEYAVYGIYSTSSQKSNMKMFEGNENIFEE